MLKKNLQILLCSTLLVSCAQVPIADSEYCAVQGKLSIGMSCVTTFSGKKRRLDLEQTVKFLEADVESGKGAAVCQSSKDFAATKSSLEALCKISKNMCKPEHKRAIKNLGEVK